mmetsp:Transcript_2455/g.4578  ORF Transcript_2455/g.4578 Transcript_2455/m.4578 type:complete len:214 (-) Transcript_2455:196-837(-)
MRRMRSGQTSTSCCFCSVLSFASISWLRVTSGMKRYVATATGHHFACSLLMPRRAWALMTSCWPCVIFTRLIPLSWLASISSWSRKLATLTFGCCGSTTRSALVMLRVEDMPSDSSNSTWRFNSMEHFSQRPSHVQSRGSLNCSLASPYLPSEFIHLMGNIPSLCARYSSSRHVVFSCTSTRSMARVGTSAIIRRRRVFATDVSVSKSSKTHV